LILTYCRVKAIDTLTTPTTTYLGSASSDGKVHVYDLGTILESSQNSSPIEPAQLEPAAVFDTSGSRLTCLTLAEDAGGSAPVELGKRKRSPLNGDRRNESDESDEDEDGDQVESEEGRGEEDGVEEENEEEEEDEEEVEME
jgi:protein MAK11